MKLQVDIMARELCSEFFIWFGDPYERNMLTWRPGFYSELRYKSYERSGLAWGAIFEKIVVLTSFPRLPCSIFQEHVPNMSFSPNVLDSKEL